MTKLEANGPRKPSDCIHLSSGSAPPGMMTPGEYSQNEINAIVRTVPGGVKNVQDIYPLSPLQQGMLFHHLLNQQSDTYVLITLLELDAHVEVAALTRALQRVIDRHDILRSAVFWEGLTRPVQVVHRKATLLIENLELNAAGDPVDQLRDLMAPECQGMNLTQAPLVRLQVVAHSSHGKWYAVLKLHHLLCEHQSWHQVVAETAACLQGREEELPEPAPYRDYVAWSLARAATQDAEAFFRDKLGHIDEPTAPFDVLDVRGDVSHIKEARRTLEPELVSKLREQAKRLGISTARLFHAAWGLVVAGTSGRDEVVFGTVVRASGRRRKETSPMLGLFVNTLPLRLSILNVTAEELVTQTHREIDKLLSQDQASLALAQRCSGVTGTKPLFTAVLNYRYSAGHSVVDPTSEAVASAPLRVLMNQFRTNFPITLVADDFGDRLTLTAQTDRGIDPHRVLGYMSTAMQSLVQALDRAPQTPALALQIMPESEHHKILELFNSPRKTYPEERRIHEIFQDQVRRTPAAVAVVYLDQSLTYAQLNGRANQLARYLKEKGVGEDQLVGICVDRSLELAVGLVGILKAGAAYVPLDPAYPPERLAHMLQDAAPKVLLTLDRLRKSVSFTAAEVIALDGDWAHVAAQPETDLPRATQPGTSARDLAYVIYTSGSTGRPKGVMVEHRNVTRLFAATEQWFGFNERDVWTFFHSFAFDFSVWELWGALFYGGKVVIVPYLTARSPQEFYQLLCREGVTVLNQTPSAFSQLIDAQARSEENHKLRVVVFGGEPLVLRTLRPWVERNGAEQPQLVNMYGITETTVHVTYYPLTKQDIDSERGSLIGKPLPDLTVYLLDRQGQPVPIGVPGEIYVGGDGVARGYLNRLDLTAERFIGNAFSADGQARLYKSGDMGRWRADGSLEHLGRNDHQIKIRGYRIELGEIEAQIARNAYVKDVAVLAREDEPGEKRLVAYVVADRNAAREMASSEASNKLRHDIVSGWETVFKQTYESDRLATGPSFAGWNSTYTGQPIPEAQMQEWLDWTVERIRALHPTRVLEIGCGVGLLLQHIAPQCAVYVGTDFSAAAVDQLQKWMGGRNELKHVELLRRSATELQEFKAGSFDTVVLNSVAQYFPDIEYLLAVLREAVRLLSPGGRIFIGDIRHLGTLVMFHSAIQLNKAAATVSLGQLKKRIARAVAQEKELIIDPQFFDSLRVRVPGVAAVEIQLKRGRAPNELTHHRYDVVLQIGESSITTALEYKSLQWKTAGAELQESLQERRWRAVRLNAVPNARLTREAEGQRLIMTSDERLDVSDLRSQLNAEPFKGVEPETFWELGEMYGYAVHITWSERSPECFDVQLVDRARAHEVAKAVSPLPEPIKPWGEYATDPIEHTFTQQLIPQLREYLSTRLPTYMIPAAWMMLKEMPLTTNGKLDRRALPAPQSRPDEMGEYVAPRTDLERTLADIWAQLLQVDQVGAKDNFFELGGHSLLIVQMMERLRRVGLFTKVRSVYEAPTLAALAITLSAEPVDVFELPPNLIPPGCTAITPQMLPLVSLAPEEIESIVKSVPGGAKNIQDIYPLTQLQEGILFHSLLTEGRGDIYIVTTLLSLASREKLEELVESLQYVIDRHDILRTAVLWEKLPRAVQVVYRQATLSMDEIALDLDCDLAMQFKEWTKPTRHRLDIRHAPLLRLQVAADPRGGSWYALLLWHHLANDHESLEIFCAEVAAVLKGRALELPEPVPYRNHVARALAQDRLTDAETFFRRKLAEIDEPSAPFGLLDVHGAGSEIQEFERELEPVLAERVRTQARRLGLSTATLFHAAWGLVIAHTCGRDDVVFGSVLLGRMQGGGGAQRTLGMFMNTLPLRLRLREETATGLVEQTQREVVDLLSHDQAPLAVAQRCSGMEKSATLFSALLNYRHSTVDVGTELAAAGVTLLSIQSWTNYPIVLTVDDKGDSFLLLIHADPRVDPRRMMGYMHTVTASLVQALEQAPNTPALALPVLPENERHQVLELFNATRKTYPQGKLVHELFEAQAQRGPQALALICGDQQLTYAQLNRRANQLARTLQAVGVRPDERVCLYVERGIEMVVGMLAILKAGGAYVPLDVSYPTERLVFMLRDSAPVALLTVDRLKGIFLASDARVISLDADADGISCQPDGDLDPLRLSLTPDNLAYVIYTSGSTGSPKGVMVEHRNLVNLVHWHCAEFDVKVGSRCSSVAAVGFDAAAWEIWPSLCAGATLFLASSEVSADPEALLSWWAEQPLDVSFLPTPLAELALSRNVHNSKLQTLLVGGDRLRRRPRSESFRLINNYGPTESTVVATSGCIHDEDAVLHIGYPIANTYIYILDRHRQPVPMGATGEIYIGGAGVARGYQNRPELTKDCFVPNPFSGEAQARMYRSGDLARWRSDGSIDFMGRNDDQVKIRGFRIELGEIAAQIARLGKLKDVVVVAREDMKGEKRLVAYVIPDIQTTPEVAKRAEELRRHLQAVLPEYMVPSAFVVLDRFPLTPNGKLDRRALPAPSVGSYVTHQYEPPVGEVEEIIAELWTELLPVERAGREDNFFDLGGHSLLAMQLAARIQSAFAIDIPVGALFKFPTVKHLSSQVEELRRVQRLKRLSTSDAEVDQLFAMVESMPEHEVQELMRELTGGAQAS